MSSLTIFVLRVAQLHMGRRTGATLGSYLFNGAIIKRTFWTIIWYYVSGFLFSETYMFSTSDSANLGWIDQGKAYERAKLNERAVLLRSMFAMLSCTQAILHVYGDYDELQIPLPATDGTTKQRDVPSAVETAPRMQQLFQQAQAQLLPVLIRSLIITIVVGIWGPVLYFAVFRSTAWSLAYTIGKIFFSLKRGQSPSGLSDVFALFARYLTSAFMLTMMWQVTNLAFTTFVKQEPLRKGQPLTSQSKDPNGSLVSGLKAKRELPYSMALWELRIISERFEDRRRAIFNDVEKGGSSTWLNSSSTCLLRLKTVSASIKGSKSAPHQPTALPEIGAPATKPRLTQPLIQDQQILRPAPRPTSALEAIADGVGVVAKTFGQSPGGSPLANKARAYLTAPPGQEPSIVKRTESSLSSYSVQLLRSPLGGPFRITFAQHVNRIVFGSPYSNAADVHNAARALARLTVASLREDSFGQAQKDVGNIMRVFMEVIQDLQTLLRTLEPHWTDVYFNGTRRVPEVDELLITLKEGLGSIVMNFGEYIEVLGITKAELRTAKNLAGQGQEMVMRVSQ